VSAGSSDFVLRSPMPRVFTDAQLRSLDIPVLTFLAGRSVMHDAGRAAARARDLLPNGQIELWADASRCNRAHDPVICMTKQIPWNAWVAAQLMNVILPVKVSTHVRRSLRLSRIAGCVPVRPAGGA